jgi:hypothetical protein
MFGSTQRAPQRASYTDASVSVLDTSTMSWTAIGGYTAAILIVLLIILLFVHYTLYPIFQIQPGGPGFIRFLPAALTQSQVGPFWIPPKGPFEDISQNTLPGFNWSMVLDFAIMNPVLQNIDSATGTQPKYPTFRLLFNRGGTAPAAGSANDGSIGYVLKDHNLAIGLLKDTNDLYISVTTDNGEKGVLLNNIPTQTPFRIGVVMMANYIEVYLNGKLAKTLPLGGTIRTIDPMNCPFQAPKTSPLNQIARVGNLMIWSYAVNPSIIKYALPELMPGDSTDKLSSGIGACGTPLDGALASFYDSTMAQLGAVVSNIPPIPPPPAPGGSTTGGSGTATRPGG